MPVKVLIPTPLRKMTNDQAEVSADGASVAEVLENLGKIYAGLRERILDENGKIRRFVNVYLNEEDIRFLKSEQTAVKDGDTLSIVPAIAGGAHFGPSRRLREAGKRVGK